MIDLDDSPRAATGGVVGLGPMSSSATAAAVGLLFGGLTELGQTHLPASLHSLANSAAPWVLIAVCAALVCRTPRSAAVAGSLALAGLEIGYVALGELRHFPSASTTVAFWLLAAVVIGPVAGLIAHSLRVGREPWKAIGGGLLAGMLSGEGLAAYLSVRDTTSPGYWIAQMAVGMVGLVVVGRRNRFGWSLVAFAIGVCGLLATRLVQVF